MAKYKCVQCGKESEIQTDLENCPFCQAEISDDQQITMTESADIAATIDTARPMGTLDAPGRLKSDQGKDLAPDRSEKTVQAADLGYADVPSHLRTLDRTDTVYESAGKSSAIPPRTIAEDDTDQELRDYKLVSEIGSGSFGSVFRAVQVPLDRTVAIKLLKPLPLAPSTEGDQSKEARQQAEWKIKDEFLREAQFTGKLEHPNIVPIHDIGIVSGGKRSDRPFYVMKEIKGISWQDVITEKTRDENVDIFNRVVDAMGFSHSRSILHCDLKPENVMLGEFGEVLVVDWGQAVDTTRPETLRPGGTPAYCSPEMARYWCDSSSKKGDGEDSKRQIGPRSDVYLLGAILFQIVTSRPPHFGLKGETPVDVMERAAQNQIRNFDKFANDELLQIALRALRKSELEEISTVAQLQAELKSYEEKKQSIDIRDRAFELLDEARISTNYDTYQKAKFGFEESLELWKGNPTAKDGLHQTRLSCAQLALKDQNFDLGLGMLTEADTKDEIQVKDKLLVGKRNRDRRKRLVFVLSLAFAAAVVGGLALTTYLGNVARNERIAANSAKDDLVVKEVEVKGLEVKAKGYEKQIADFEPKMAALQTDYEVKEANLDQQFVDKGTELNNQFTAKEMVLTEQFGLRESEFKEKEMGFVTKENEFLQKQAGFQTALTAEQQKVLDEQKKVAAAKEASELLRYKTKITSVEQKVASGDYRAAAGLLNLEQDKSSFEWRRLNLLSHPEVTEKSLFPNENLKGARLSGDRSKLALCFEDRIEIRDSVDLNKLIASLKEKDVETMALSNEGQKLAIGKQGTIRIVEVATQRVLGAPLSAQSDSITDLEFSRNGNRLLSVGVPDKIRSSVNSETALMIFESVGDEWEKIESPRFKGQPATPTRASFSDDGNRIVTSSPNADQGAQVAYILEWKDGGYYEWLDRFDDQSPRRKLKPGFVTSIFADESGRKVISSFASESESGKSNQIVVWDVDQPADTIPVSTGIEQIKNQNLDDVSYPNFNPLQSVSVDSKIHYLDYNGQILLATQDKKLIYRELPANGLLGLPLAYTKEYRGHGRPILFSGILNSGSKFLSIALGANPEILLTDTADYRVESIPLHLDNSLADGSSPISLSESIDSEHLIVGNDHGLISINETGALKSPIMKWEVSAWDKHLVTRTHLFAMSRRDDVYRYNLVSGELEQILTGLAQIQPSQKADSDMSNKISSIEISEDSRFAVVQRKNGKREFEIWNLADQTSRVVSYATLQGIDDVEKLPLLTISPDGQWISGGRIRFYVWRNDGTVVGNAGIENNVKRPISSLRFIAGTSRIAVGSKGRLRVYDIEDGLDFQSYAISGFPDFFGKPNIVDARKFEGESYLVIRRTFDEAGKDKESGLDLIQIDGKDDHRSVSSFPGAQQASLTTDGELIAVSLAERALVRFDLKTNQTRTQKIIVPPRDVAGKPTEARDIFSGVFAAPSGELVLQWTSANRQNTVTVTNDGKLSNLSVIATPTVQAVGISGNRALSFENGQVRLWKLNFEGQPSVRPAGSVSGNFKVFELSPSGSKAFAVNKGQSKIGVIDVASGEFVADVTVAENGAITSAAWSSDGAQLAIGFANGSLEIWRDGTSEMINTGLAESPVEHLRFSGDGNSIVVVQNSASDEGVAFVVRKSAEKEGEWFSVRLLHTDRDSITSADISNDGERVVTGSKRGRVTLWNAKSKVGTSEDKEIAERELLGIHQFSSPVRYVKFGKNDSSVISFETDSPDSGASIFPTK